jgi:hypothetical protein
VKLRHVRELRKALPDGLDVRQDGTGRHPLVVVIVATGEPLRTEEGIPIRVATSPSDWRAQRNIVSRCQRAFEAHLRRAIKEALK